MPSTFLRVDGGVGLASSPRAAGVSEQVQKPSLVAPVVSGSGVCVWALGRLGLPVCRQLQDPAVSISIVCVCVCATRQLTEETVPA